MKKRKRLGPLEKAIKTNIERENKDPKKTKVGIAGGHPGQARAKGMVPISRTRLILADGFIRSRSYLDLLRCFNSQFFSQAEADDYSGSPKLVKEGRNVRYRRWQWALNWFAAMMPKPSVSESKLLHLHGMSLDQAAKEPGKATEAGFDVMARVQQIAHSPRSQKMLDLIEKQKAETKAVLKEIKEDEESRLLDFKKEMETLPKGKDYDFEEAEFEESD